LPTTKRNAVAYRREWATATVLLFGTEIDIATSLFDFFRSDLREAEVVVIVRTAAENCDDTPFLVYEGSRVTGTDRSVRLKVDIEK
jgi:hypothetical protein